MPPPSVNISVSVPVYLPVYLLALLLLALTGLSNAGAPSMTIESWNMTYSYYDGFLSQGRPIYDIAKVITKDFTISEPDSDNIAYMVVDVQSGYVYGDTLACTDTVTAITCVYTATTTTGVLNMTGVTTAANYQTAARLVTYYASDTHINTDTNCVHEKKIRFRAKSVTNPDVEATAMRQLVLTTAQTIFTDDLACPTCY